MAEIQIALDQCHLGLLLISPRFLGSPFIKQYELSRFTGDDAKPVIPVILQPVDFRRQNSLGLERSFAECTNENLRDEFATGCSWPWRIAWGGWLDRFERPSVGITSR